MLNFLDAEFIKNAFLVGTIVAIVSSIVGYFVVIRGLAFAGEALTHIGFAGATGAVLIGINPICGLLTFTVASGIIMGFLGERVRGRDVSIGIVLSFALGLGALFLSLYTQYAQQAFSILFGTILGVSRTDVIQTFILSIICILAMSIIYRPLLFSSIDNDVAKAKGVNVVLVSVIFFIILAVTVSIAVQVVGILLIFTLLLAPAATAQYLTSKPINTILLSVIIAIFETWVGIILSYFLSWPVSFFIATVAFTLYVSARLYSRVDTK